MRRTTNDGENGLAVISVPLLLFWTDRPTDGDPIRPTPCASSSPAAVHLFLSIPIMSTSGGAPITSEQLKARYIGTGHADMTKYEWATNQHRDTMASHVGHYDQLSYYAVAQNESVGRVRAQMLEKMLEPCGPPPTKKKQQEPSS